MNGFHITPELLRQIEAASTAMESIRRAQKALDHAPVLEGIRRAQEDIRRTQQALARSPVLEGVRRAQEDIRRMQQALARSPVLEGIRRTLEAWNNSSLALQRAIQAVRVDALDLRVAHGGNRLGAHVTEAVATRERARRRDLWGRRLGEFGQAATKRLMRLASRRKVGRPVGSSLHSFAEFVFSKKSYEEIYEPLISDLRFEYCEALAANRRGKARWARVRGYGSFLAAMLAHVPAWGSRLAFRVWRFFQVGG